MKPPEEEALVPRVEKTSILHREPELAESARKYASRARAKNTLRARAADWRVFEAWCARHGVSSDLPVRPDVVVAFLAAQSDGPDGEAPKEVSTIVRYARTIHGQHRRAGQPSPLENSIVRDVLTGIQHARGVLPPNRKDALTVDLLPRALPVGDDLASARDRAILTLGVATGMRRSEIVALEVSDFVEVDRGLVVTIRRSKTDQAGKGRTVALARVDAEPTICPVTTLRAWLLRSGIVDGPVFRGLWKGGKVRPTALTDRALAMIVKEAATRAGLDVDDFGGHSLRSGYITSAVERGLPWEAIMKQTGHKTFSVAESYSRHTPAVFDTTRAVEVMTVRRGSGWRSW